MVGRRVSRPTESMFDNEVLSTLKLNGCLLQAQSIPAVIRRR